MMETPLGRGLAVVLCACVTACTAQYDAFQIDRQLSKTVGAAQFHLGLQEYAEAAQLAHAVENIDPEYPGLADVKAKLPGETEDLFAARLIGSNRARRKPIERSTVGRVLRYLPDRLSDLFDIVSVDVHSGAGAFADVHATRAAQLSAGARVVGGLGSYALGNNLGFQLQADAAAYAMGLGEQRFTGFNSGGAGVFGSSGELRGVQRPMDRFYQDYRDYWGIGFSGTAGFVGGGAELHPVQLIDFLLGFAGIDIANDDEARTAPLRILLNERDLLQELARIEASPALLEEYRRNRDKLQELTPF